MTPPEERSLVILEVAEALLAKERSARHTFVT
jgi:hypothetical protein